MTSDQTTPTTRAERTRQTRKRMLDSARELFISQGYPDTAMTQIADKAEVAVQTLYYTFKTKGRLLVEVVEVTAAGDDDAVPVPERDWFVEMMSSTDAQRLFALLVEYGTTIYDRVAALWPPITAALSDPFVAEYWEGIGAGRRQAQLAQITRVAQLGQLKPGLPIEKATDMLFLLSGHAPYRALVEDAGWPFVEYKGWLFTTLVEQLVDAPAIDVQVATDLSFADLVPYPAATRSNT